jgi:hypothetical protein
MSITIDELNQIEIGDYVVLNERCGSFKFTERPVIGFDTSMTVEFGAKGRILTEGTPNRAWPASYIKEWHPAKEVNFVSHEGTGLLDLFSGLYNV